MEDVMRRDSTKALVIPSLGGRGEEPWPVVSNSPLCRVTNDTDKWHTGPKIVTHTHTNSPTLSRVVQSTLRATRPLGQKEICR